MATQPRSRRRFVLGVGTATDRHAVDDRRGGTGEAVVRNDGLDVSWPTGTATTFDLEFLRSLGDAVHSVRVRVNPEPWLANDPELQFELALRPGDMVIFDNWRLLHGRRAFVGERLIAGGYVNREDFESTTRLLQ